MILLDIPATAILADCVAPILKPLLNELVKNLPYASSTIYGLFNNSKGSQLKVDDLHTVIEKATEQGADLSKFREYMLGLFEEIEIPDISVMKLMLKIRKALIRAEEINLTLDEYTNTEDSVTAIELSKDLRQLADTLRAKAIIAMDNN